jgi:hypothetical protein
MDSARVTAARTIVLKIISEKRPFNALLVAAVACVRLLTHPWRLASNRAQSRGADRAIRDFLPGRPTERNPWQSPQTLWPATSIASVQTLTFG